MALPQLRESPASTCKTGCLLLSLIWCLSLGTGVIFSFIMQPSAVSLMCIAPQCRVSILGLIMIFLPPLILSAAAVKFSLPALIYLTAALDGAAMGYFLSGVVLAFGPAGWLPGSLLSFSKLLFTVPKLWFFFLCLENHNRLFSGLAICIFAAMIIGLFDYFLISPFLYALFV